MTIPWYWLIPITLFLTGGSMFMVSGFISAVAWGSPWMDRLLRGAVIAMTSGGLLVMLMASAKLVGLL